MSNTRKPDSTHSHPHDDIGCLEAIEQLYAYLDGELEDEISRAQVEYHLGHCRSCYSRAQVERALNEHLNASGSKAPESLQQRMKQLLDDF